MALAGTGLVAAGASVLNQVMERDTDALMLRTRTRPIPSGRILPGEARAFGALLTATGLAVLVWLCGPLAAAVALATWASYLFAYTPLKRRTPLATLVGAVPGALPPVIGWAAARGRLDAGAFILFAILFLWQIPHFLAIAWLYRDDYARAGFPMLPVLDREGTFAGRQAVVHSLALLLVSLAPAVAGLAGPAYLAGAFLLGVALTLFALRLARARDLVAARGLFLASAGLPAGALVPAAGGAAVTWQDLPTLNAVLNTASAVLLLAGWWLIRHGRRDAHRRAMLARARDLDPLPRLVPRLPLRGGLGPLHRPGPHSHGLLRDPRQPHGAGRGDRAARPGHAHARAARPLRGAPRPRAHHPPAVAVGVRVRRRRLLDAVPALDRPPYFPRTAWVWRRSRWVVAASVADGSGSFAVAPRT